MLKPEIKASPSPPSHQELRNAIALLKRGRELNDGSIIDNTLSLARSTYEIDASIYALLVTYSDTPLSSAGEDVYYSLHSPEDRKEAETELIRLAYGDFNEALHLLQQDLFNLDPTINRGEPFSDIFDANYFTPEQQKLWNELRQPVEDSRNNPGQDFTKEAMGAFRKLRHHQQQVYGQLLPTMVATYLSNGEEESRGVSIQLIWDDPTLIVNSQAPFNVDLDEYFINTHPVESLRDFIPSAFPQTINDYTLQDVTSENLFRYELGI